MQSSVRTFVLLLLAALLAIGTAACSSDDPAQKDVGPKDDSATGKDGSGDGVVTDAKPDAPQPDAGLDGPKPDGPIEVFDGRVLRKGQLTGGSGVSTGGQYTLQSQLGPGLGVQPMSGGSYELRWNASIIPW